MGCILEKLTKTGDLRSMLRLFKILKSFSSQVPAHKNFFRRLFHKASHLAPYIAKGGGGYHPNYGGEVGRTGFSGLNAVYPIVSLCF